MNCADEFREFFSKFGRVTDHEIIRDHATSRPRGFGFIVFDSEKAVDDLFAKKGNMIDLNGAQVSLADKKIRRAVSPVAKIISFFHIWPIVQNRFSLLTTFLNLFAFMNHE